MSGFGGQAGYRINNTFAQEVVGGLHHVYCRVDGTRARLAWVGTAGRANRPDDRTIRTRNNHKKEQRNKRNGYFVLSMFKLATYSCFICSCTHGCSGRPNAGSMTVTAAAASATKKEFDKRRINLAMAAVAQSAAEWSTTVSSTLQRCFATLRPWHACPRTVLVFATRVPTRARRPSSHARS